MKVYSGILERVGNGSWLDGKTEISVLKIGDTLLSNIVAHDRFYSLLDIGKPMTIYVYRLFWGKKMIIGVNHDQGDKVCLTIGQAVRHILGISALWLVSGWILWLVILALGMGLFCNLNQSQDIFVDCTSSIAKESLVVVGVIYILSLLHFIKDYFTVRALTI